MWLHQEDCCVISVRAIGVVSVVHGATGETGRRFQQSWVGLGV